MKKLAISEEIKGFDGISIAFDNRPITVRDVLMAHIGSHAGNSGEEMIRIRNLGQRIFDCKKKSLEFEDADFAIIKQSLDKPQFSAIVMGPVWEMINNAKE